MYIIKLKSLALHWSAEELLTARKYKEAQDYCEYVSQKPHTIQQVISPTLEDGKAKLEEVLRKDLIALDYNPKAFQYDMRYTDVDETGCFWEPGRQDNSNQL